MRSADGGPMRPSSAVDPDGNPVRLDRPTGAATLLSFYRYASCRLCDLRIAKLRRKQSFIEGLGLRPLINSPGIRRSIARTLAMPSATMHRPAG